VEELDWVELSQQIEAKLKLWKSLQLFPLERDLETGLESSMAPARFRLSG